MNDTTEWVAISNWEELSGGDRVRLSSQLGTIDGVLYVQRNWGGGPSLILENNATEFHQSQWQLFVPAPPKVKLPTEPGHYISPDGFIVRLGDDSDWRLLDGRLAPYIHPHQTRIQPVAVTAKAIHNRLRELNRTTSCSDIDRFLMQLSVDFGVTDD